MEGWIKLHRKFLEWEWFDDTEAVKLFLYLLLSANHKDGKWRGEDIKRGQLITGLNSLSDKLNLSIKVIRNRLDKLEKTGEIGRQTGTRYTVVTICKYNDYQHSGAEEGIQTGTQGANEGQTKGTQRATNKNVKNKKNDNNKKNIIPAFEEFKEYALSKKSNIDIPSLKLKYESWVESGWKTGMDKPIINWKTTLLNTIPYIKEIKNESRTPYKQLS